MAETDYTDWKDFANRVARVIVEADGDNSPAFMKAVEAYMNVSPFYICISLVYALNELEREN